MARTPQSQSPDTEVAGKKKSPERLIYIGPNVPGGILSRYQIFKGGFPPHCEELFKKLPEIKKLFVDVLTLSKAQEQLDKEGSELARVYGVVAKALATKGGV